MHTTINAAIEKGEAAFHDDILITKQLAEKEKASLISKSHKEVSNKLSIN
jgi:hypothetical protein